MANETPGILKGIKRIYKEKLIHRFVDEVAETFPEETALIYEAENESKASLSFHELANCSNQLARAILNVVGENSFTANVNGNWVIGILMKPTLNAIITMLAIWKCGASYLPINSFYTKSRFQEIIDEVLPQMVITDDEMNMKSIKNVFSIGFEKLKSIADESNPAYLIDDYSFALGKDSEALTIYSSGTLGRPKGTSLFHSQCQKRLEWQWMKFPFAENETHCIARIPHCHIDHFAEIWGALCNGKTLVIVDEKFQNDEMKLIETMQKYKVQRFTALPNLINSIVAKLKMEEKRLLKNVRLWISTGEQLMKSTAESFFDYFDNHMLVNFYGCTETTGECASYTIESREHFKQLTGDEIPIGSPTINTYIYVMNKSLSPTSKVGEIFVAGEMVTQCYVYEDEENPSTLNNHLSLLPAYSRLFRTNDYGLIRNGLLYFRGRSKSKRMIRINGNLIDLIAIESFLDKLEYISKAAVAIKDEEKGDLLAFVSLNRGFAYITEKIIQRELCKNLPSYITPEVFILHELPSTKGNTDYKELLNKYDDISNAKHRNTIVIDVEVSDFDDEHQEMARQVFEIVGESIGHTINGAISSERNFYDLGGNSLNLLLTVTKLGEAKFNISVDDFFRASSMKDLVEKCIKSRNVPIALNIEPRIAMTIEPITDYDMEKCANLLAKCYLEKNNLIKFIGNLKSENIYDFLEANWKFFVDRALSFKVIEKREGILGVSLNYEKYESVLKKKDIQAMEPIYEFIGFVEDNMIKTQFPNEHVITPFMMGTSASLNAEENIRVVFTMEQHLIRLMREKNFKAIVAIESCPLNVQIHKSNAGYETVREFQVNRYVDKNGQRPFQQAEDTLKTCVQVYANVNDAKKN